MEYNNFYKVIIFIIYMVLDDKANEAEAPEIGVITDMTKEEVCELCINPVKQSTEAQKVFQSSYEWAVSSKKSDFTFDYAA